MRQRESIGDRSFAKEDRGGLEENARRAGEEGDGEGRRGFRGQCCSAEEMVEHKKTEGELRMAQQAADCRFSAKSEFLAKL